jgi:hypothetical protein
MQWRFHSRLIWIISCVMYLVFMHIYVMEIYIESYPNVNYVVNNGVGNSKV